MGPDPDGTPGARVVNARYAAEHPALLAPSLAHDLLWSGDGHDRYEEATLHAVLAMVHLQVVARSPWIAHLGTELARRQNSLAVTLLDSRHPGSARHLRARRRRARHHPRRRSADADPRLLVDPVRRWARLRAGRAGSVGLMCSSRSPPSARPCPTPSATTTAWPRSWPSALGRRWLGVAEQLRVAIALGLLEVDDVAAAVGVSSDAAVRAYGLAAAQSCWPA